MAIAAEKLKILRTNSVSVVADQLGVQLEDLLNAMEKEILVYNWRGFGDSPPYYYKPPPASEMIAKFSVWRKLNDYMALHCDGLPVIKIHCPPLIFGWFGRSLLADNLTRHIFNGEEYVLDPKGTLLHAVDLEQHKDWKINGFLSSKEWISQYYNPEEIAEYLKEHLMKAAKDRLNIHKGEHHKRKLKIKTWQPLRTLPRFSLWGREGIKVVTETDGIRATNQEQFIEVSHNLDLPISEDENDDQEYKLTDQEIAVSLEIDGYYEKSENYNLRLCEITLLPRLEIGDELLVPIETCARLIGLKHVIANS